MLAEPATCSATPTLTSKSASPASPAVGATRGGPSWSTSMHTSWLSLLHACASYLCGAAAGTTVFAQARGVQGHCGFCRGQWRKWIAEGGGHTPAQARQGPGRR